MDTAIIVALISLAGNLLGSIFAIAISNKLMEYRVEKMENTVNKIEPRVYELEKYNAVQDQKIDHIEDKLKARA